MNATVLFTALLLPTAATDASDSLFAALDANGDGKVAASEISETQRPWFQRALRVADRNDDGVLSSTELSIAVSDPKPVDIAESDRRPGRRPNFDITRFDRNNDGNLSKDEVPGPLRERFEQAFDRYGKDTIPIEELKKFSARRMPAAASPNKKADSKAEKLSPRPNSAMRRPSGDNAATFFERMDRNNDGKLTATEMPERMRDNARRMDRNGDKVISKAEFIRAVEMREKRER